MGIFNNKIMCYSIIFNLIVILFMPIAFGSGSESVINNDQSSARKHQTQWSYQNLWTDNDHTSDLIIADVYPHQPGDEIITVNDNHYATMIYGNGESWKNVRIFEDDFLLKSIAIGDFYPQHPGDEMAVAGFSGFVTMLYFDETSDEWYSEQIYEDYDLVHDVAVGDIDPTHPGDELVCVGESRQLSYIYFDQDKKAWSSEIIWSDKDYTSIVALGEIYNVTPGLEIAVAGGTHDVHLVSGKAGDWTVERLWHEGTFIRELEVTELDKNESTGEIYVAGFTNNVTMLSVNESGAWTGMPIWNDTAVINDLLVTDYFPDHSGNELIVLNGAGDVTMLHNHETYWHNETLYTLPNSPSKIAVGDYDGFHAGNEFAVLEFKGRLSGLALETFDFTLLSPQDTISVIPGERLELDLLVIENGGFDELVHLNVFDVINSYFTYMHYVDIQFETTSLTPTGFVEVSINISEDIPVPSVRVVFVGASESSEHYLNVTLIFVKDSRIGEQYNMNMALNPRVEYIVADHTTNFLVKLKGIEEGSYIYQDQTTADIHLYIISLTFVIENAPIGISMETDWKSPYCWCAEPKSEYILNLRADTNVPPGSYLIFIKAIRTYTDEKNNVITFERTRIMQLTVEPINTPDFFIELAPDYDIRLLDGTEYTWTISLNAISGFDKTVELEVEFSKPSWLEKLELSRSSLKPGVTIELKISSIETGNNVWEHLLITYSSAGKIKFVALDILLTFFTTELELAVDPLTQTANSSDESIVNLTIEPVNLYFGDVDLRLYHVDDNNNEWEDYRINFWINKTSIIPFSFNLSEIGTYNFTIVAVVWDDFISDYVDMNADFTIEVKKPSEPDNGGNGDTNDNGDEQSFLSQNALLLAGVLIIILVIVVVYANAVAERRKQKKKKIEEEGKDEKSAGKTGMQRPRPPERRGLQSLEQAEPMHRIKDGKIEHVHPKDTEEYQMGKKVFKPGGKHEFEFMIEDKKRKT